MDKIIKQQFTKAAMMLLMMLLTATTAGAWSGSGTEESPYQITSTDDLDQLATDVNGGNGYDGKYFVLTKDITYTHTTDWNDANSTESNYTAIGGYYNSQYKHFKGHFDGQNHTVSGIRIYKGGNEEADYCQALFGLIEGATVKNIILADARITGFRDCGGIVGSVFNSGRIENCHALSTVTIHAARDDAHRHGGIVGKLECYEDVTVVEGCTSAASITTTADNIFCDSYGGIVGDVGPNCTISDCIYLGSTVEGANRVGAIAGQINNLGTVRNCYYTSTTIHGKNNNGSTLDNDASAIGEIYSSATVTDVRLATSDDFAVSGNTYTIGSAAGWSIFCGALYHNNTYNRFSGKTVTLGANITVSRMAGSEYHDFCGTFDGGGHTLTFNYGTSTAPNSDQYTAPFRYVSNTKPVGSNTDSPVTIRNLHVAGDIHTTAKCAAGLIARQWGTVNIENCRSSIVVHSNVTNDDNDGTHSGFVSVQQNGTLSFTGCTFDGKLLTDATNVTTKCGGFVGYRSGSTGVTASITNCLYAPAGLAEGETEAVGNSATFVRNWNGTPTNSYYTRLLGTEQGKQAHSITAGQSITVALSGTATTYSVSGITAYKDGNTQKPGLLYNGTIYAGNGDAVSLTLQNTAATAPLGYRYRYIVNGSTLYGSTLTMPDADVTVSATLRSTGEAVDVSYVKDDGTTGTASAIALDGTENSLYAFQETEMWYFVGTDISYTGSVCFSFVNGDNGDNANLILCDGATMSVNTNTTDDAAVYTVGSNLTIYGQAKGTGKLNATSENGDGIRVSDYIFTINGGIVNATGDNVGIHCYGAGCVVINGGTVNATGDINAGNEVFINGGNVTATGDISVSYNITLGWRKATDHIYASGFICSNGHVILTKPFTDGTNIYSGTLTDAEESAIAGKTLSPCLLLANDADNSDVIAQGTTLCNGEKQIAAALQGRTLYKDGAWNTLCLPFSVTAAQMAETTHPLYGATIKELDATGTYSGKQTGFDATDGTLYLYFKDATTIEAGKPYIVKWATTGSNIENPVFNGVTIDNSTASGVTLTDDKYIVSAENTGLNTVQFIGSYSPLALNVGDKSNLFLSTSTKSGNTVSTLYYPSAANNKNGYYYVNAFRGYFHVDLGNATSVRAFQLNFGEDEKTGIVELKNSRIQELKSDTGWYALDGRKLSGKPTKKGVYVNNGKLVVIK